MKDKIFLYSDPLVNNFIINIFSDFQIENLTDELINKNDFKNNNILFLGDQKNYNRLTQSFILQNNVLLFFSIKQQIHDLKIPITINPLKYPLTTNQFFDLVRSHFFSKKYFFRDIEIYNENITNKKNNLSSKLTYLEKKLLAYLIDKKITDRESLLEEIFDLKKNISTKTIESHLSRIRKKLLFVQSEIKITSKGNRFYIDN